MRTTNLTPTPPARPICRTTCATRIGTSRRRAVSDLTKLIKELGYGHEYRYAHDEPDAYAAGETYLPDNMRDPHWYEPTPRGLRSDQADKGTWLRSRIPLCARRT